MKKKGDKSDSRILGMQWWLAAAVIALVAAAAGTGALSADLAGCFALMLSIGIVCYLAGERIPIWNQYVGGGLMLTYLVAALLHTYQIIPAEYISGMQHIMQSADFLTFFILFVIAGSILALDRQFLICSFSTYFPAIMGGLVGASVMGILAGEVFGMTSVEVMLNYVLPIMGGGNGTGAVPMSEIYESVTGGSAADYYSIAITTLTIGNVFAILMATFLKKMGEKKPEWTGHGRSLVRGEDRLNVENNQTKPTIKEWGGAFYLVLGLYALSRLFSETLLPKICGVMIHPITYFCVFTTVLAVSGAVTNGVRAATRRLQSFFTTNMLLIIMVGVGMETNLFTMISLISFPTIVIALAIVTGSMIGSGIIGDLVGFYPIDAALTAGLCMANRGGSGDISVLDAAERRSLMPYAQLSSRLGGGTVLILGSVLMGLFLK